MTFSPDEPLCVGERVQMVCYVVPRPAEVFVIPSAYVSFNGSTPASLSNIN